MGVLPLCLCVILLSDTATSTFQNIGVPEDDDFIPGDINIAVLESFYWSRRKWCDTWDPGVMQSAEAIRFRLNAINEDQSILPNISLGVVMLSDCWEIPVTLFRTTKLIPVESCMGECCTNQVENATNPTVRGCYNVAAALLPYSSSLCIPASRLLSMYKIPHISNGASSDTLSDRDQFEYFSRPIPPDRLQTQAIIDLLVAFNWTYISMIGTTTDYSRNGLTAIRVLAKEKGICIAYSVEIRDDFTEKDYDDIIRRLRINWKAHVVITYIENLNDVIYAVKRQNAQGEFIFLASDGVAMRRYAEEAINSLEIEFSQQQSQAHDGFENHYKALHPMKYLEMSGFYEKTHQQIRCNLTLKKGENESCFNYDRRDQLPTFRLRTGYRIIIDGINLISLALDKLIRKNCPTAFLDKSFLKDCITGPELLGFIRNTSFVGYSGKIQFDEQGEGMVDYDILQHQPDGEGGFQEVVVGQWKRVEKTLILNETSINWFSLNASLYPRETELPESVCAKPCQPGEFYIQGELKCCWDCRRCRDNEKVRDDNEGCVICPYLTWPNQENFTTCIPIPPTFMNWLDPIALGLLGLSGIGLVTTMAITYIFTKYRTKKVVKGSSLEQMFTIILALFMSYATAILLVAKPSYTVCQIQYYSYHLSCTLTFVPLLLKTTRLYRIFAAAERCQQEIKCVSSTALAVFSVILITCVVCMNPLIEIITS